MIKKIILFMLIAALLLPSAALANDGWYVNGDKEIGVKVIPSSFHANIGEDYIFTIELTNYTAETFDYVVIENVFSPFREAMLDVDICIEPYHTVEFEVSAYIYEGIEWYKDGSSYFITLMPTFLLSIADSEGMCLVYPDKEIAIEIDNIKNGDAFLKGEITDSKKYMLYQARETYFYSKDYSAIGEIENYVLLEKTCDREIGKIYYSGKNGYADTTTLNDYGQATCKMTFRDRQNIYDVPSRIKATHSILFEMDGEYYGIAAEKYYCTKMFYHPQIKLEVTAEKDDAGIITKQYFEITNYSGDYIRGFYINFQSGDNSLPDYIFDVISPNQTIKMDLPLAEENYIWCMYTYGYFVEEDNYIVGWIDGYLESGTEVIETDEYDKWTDYLGDNMTTYARDFDYIFTEIDMNNPHSEYETMQYLNSVQSQLNPTPTEYISPTPQPTEQIPTDTIAPIATPTQAVYSTADVVVEAAEKPYIPIWAWIAVGFALAAVIGSVGYMLLQRRKGEGDEND